jgi:hypothetical protein
MQRGALHPQGGALPVRRGSVDCAGFRVYLCNYCWCGTKGVSQPRREGAHVVEGVCGKGMQLQPGQGRKSAHPPRVEREGVHVPGRKGVGQPWREGQRVPHAPAMNGMRRIVVKQKGMRAQPGHGRKSASPPGVGRHGMHLPGRKGVGQPRREGKRVPHAPAMNGMGRIVVWR